jgi:hypothetical protein
MTEIGAIRTRKTLTGSLLDWGRRHLVARHQHLFTILTPIATVVLENRHVDRGLSGSYNP